MNNGYGFPETEARRGYRDLFSFWTPYVASRGGEQEHWYFAGQGANGFTTFAPGTDGLHFVPFVPGMDCVLDKISIRVTTGGASSTIYYGIYDNQIDVDECYPGQLVYQTSVATTASGVKSDTPCVPLIGGRLYWAFVWENHSGGGAAPVLRGMTATGSWASGGIDAAMGAVLGSYLTLTLPYDSIRGVAPTGALWNTAASVPCVAMRASA